MIFCNEDLRGTQICQETSVKNMEVVKADVPMPITVPYSLLLSVSCAEAGGQRQRQATRARKRRAREEAMERDLAREGRL